MTKFLSSLVVVACTVLLLSREASGQQQNNNNPTGCLESVDPDVDYFPDKVSPEFSKEWTVEYFNTYKIATNFFRNETYLLYQCGTEPPQDVIGDGDFAAVLEIPLQSIGITVTPYINFMEQLGALDRVHYYLTSVSYISSPCFKARVEANEVKTIGAEDGENEDSGGEGPSGVAAEPQELIVDTAVFGDGFQGELPFKDTVLVSHYTEKTNKAIFEWVEYFSLFFNLEEQANRVTEAAEVRYECVSRIADAETSDGPLPTVLWGSYSSYCGGWQTGKCAEGGNFYCEMADLCDARLLTDGEGSLEHEACGNLLTVEEFVEFGKDAEYWFYVTHFDAWNDTYAASKELLDTMVSVQNEHVYDYQGSGSNAWFQERVAKYYDVLQDFCHTVGTAPSLNRPSWFRNVFSEEIGSPGSCVPGTTIDDEPFTFDGVCEVQTDSETDGTGADNGQTGADNGRTGADNGLTGTTEAENGQTGTTEAENGDAGDSQANVEAPSSSATNNGIGSGANLAAAILALLVLAQV